eukprot:5846360-Pleurochrysis_carterae.AAC.1
MLKANGERMSSHMMNIALTTCALGCSLCIIKEVPAAQPWRKAGNEVYYLRNTSSSLVGFSSTW